MRQCGGHQTRAGRPCRPSCGAARRIVFVYHLCHRLFHPLVLRPSAVSDHRKGLKPSSLRSSILTSGRRLPRRRRRRAASAIAAAPRALPVACAGTAVESRTKAPTRRPTPRVYFEPVTASPGEGWTHGPSGDVTRADDRGRRLVRLGCGCGRTSIPSRTSRCGGLWSFTRPLGPRRSIDVRAPRRPHGRLRGSVQGGRRRVVVSRASRSARGAPPRHRHPAAWAQG